MRAGGLPVVVVSGLPRSGTSLMMQMLRAGGLELLADDSRPPDADNPRGYWEYAPVSRLREDAGWVAAAAGKAVKVVSPLLAYLPPGLAYRVVFMERAMPEILASQRAMLARAGGAAPSAQFDDAAMAERFARHLREVRAWLAAQPNFAVLAVDYDALVTGQAAAAAAVRDFLAVELGVELDAAAMAAVVDPALYRQRLTP